MSSWGWKAGASDALCRALVFAVGTVGTVVVIGSICVIVRFAWRFVHDLRWWLVAFSRWSDVCYHCLAFSFGFFFARLFLLLLFAVELLVIAATVIEEQFFADFDIAIGKHADPVGQVAEHDLGVDVALIQFRSVIDEPDLVAHSL